jgi:LysM repeat protein
MDEPQYNPTEPYGPYEEYPRPDPALGLPPSQLALIIGVNAVISLLISIGVVLLSNRPAVVAPLTPPQATTAVAQAAAETAGPAHTPIQSLTYIVQPGDTLIFIANKFAVPLFDLMMANGLTDEDFIQVGQELIIPVGGLPSPTPTFTVAPAPTETPLPYDPPTPLPTGAAIPPEPAATVGPSPTPSNTPLPTSTPPRPNEIRVTISEVRDGGELLTEQVVILNQGPGVSLKEWELDGSALGLFILPDIFLFSGGAIRIHTSAGQNTPSDLYLNQGEAAWSPGTTIILRDATNREISKLTVR